MRTKSEVRRQAILAAAAQVFREVGFERASMAEICARVGGSKATLYNYFASKEELFFEVMFLSTEAEFEANNRALGSAMEDVTQALRRFGEGMLTLLYSPPMLMVRRLMVAESGRSELGRLCYARGPQRGESLISEFVQTAMQLGKLRQADPLVATRHLRGLLEAELLDSFLFNLVETISPAEIQAVTERAITAFMAAYGPVGQ
jgi:AcrR family transcriptional regulator